MIKEEFLKQIDFEDKIYLSNIFDKYILYKKINKPVIFNDFLTPLLLENIRMLMEKENIEISSSGIFENAERKMMAFGIVTDFPINILKIKSKSKFSNLTHRDFLGAILSLGAKREKFGDLFIHENTAYISISSSILEYIQMNLNKVANSSVSLEIVDLENDYIPERSFKNIVITVMSNRLDSIISEITNLSRNKSEELISRGLVMVNYQIANNKSKEVKCGSTITIKGYGKFIVFEEIGKSAKGKTRLSIKKYV